MSPTQLVETPIQLSLTFEVLDDERVWLVVTYPEAGFEDERRIL